MPGALFAVGDGHFAQGDEEICGTAIEAITRPRIRLTVVKRKPPLKSPHYETAAERVVEMHSVHSRGEHGVVTTAEDQSSVVRKAMDGLMDWLVTEKRLTRAEVYAD